LVFQFEKEDEIETVLNISPQDLLKYDGRLEKIYDGCKYQVLSDIFQGFVGRKITTHSQMYKRYFLLNKSAQGYCGIKCSLKANEAILYPLDKSFLAVSKPPIYIPFSEITAVTFSRISSVSNSSLKTFEVKLSCTNGTEYSFSSLSR
jgi:structure-specific recognition protein 1